MPLKEIQVDFQMLRDAIVLRAIKTLEKINGQPAAEVWKPFGESHKGGLFLTDC